MIKIQNIDRNLINAEWFKNLIEQFSCDKNINIKSCAIMKNDDIIGTYSKEPYSLNDMSLLFSMTKSITSLAVGIAYDKGYLCLDDKIVDIFPDKLPSTISKNLSDMKVSDLLIMASGVHGNTYSEIHPAKDWIKAFLNQDFEHVPGTYYRYNTHGSHVLSAVIEQKTGSNLLDFLDIHLFKPLDINRPQWEIAPDGYIAGGMGLSLKTMDIVKIGHLILNDGVYNGCQIISEEYLKEATKSQIVKYSEVLEKPNRDVSGELYGYQFHIDKHGNCRMDGAFGQLCLVIKEYNMVIVVTSVNSNIECLLSAIYKALNNKFRFASKSVLEMNSNVDTFVPIQKTYAFTPNTNDIDEIVICFENESIIITHRSLTDSFISEILVNKGFVVTGQTHFVKDIQNHFQKYVSKVIEETTSSIRIRVWYLETPYIVDYVFNQNESDMELDYSINVSFTKSNFKIKADNIA